MKKCVICKEKPASGGRNGRNCVDCARDKFKSPRQRVVEAHGITLQEYEEMLEAQGGVCAICGGLNANDRALAIDHDHTCCPESWSCGKCVRGLLCGNCNLGLGYFRDNPNALESAARYLR